jgi:catechol 2,3-dioxygenase-like lactoylglutathione lyase family enzyme
MGEHISDPADVGLTHIALPVRDVNATAAFYGRFAGLRVVHRRVDVGTGVVWLADGVRPFVIVCIEHPEVSPQLNGNYAHIGVGCRDRSDLDARVADARRVEVPVSGPQDSGPPIGYWAILTDPDGHQLELSVGQEISKALASAD